MSTPTFNLKTPAADSSKAAALSEYRKGGWSSVVAALLVGLIAAFVYFRAKTTPIQVTCDRKQMRPGDLCIGKRTYGYEDGLRTATMNKAHALAAMPWALALIGLVLLFLIIRTVMRKSDIAESANASYHGSRANGSGVGVFFGLGLLTIALFLYLGPKDDQTVTIWVPVGLAVVGLVLLFVSIPRATQLVRADDDGLLVVNGMRERWIDFDEVTGVDQKLHQNKDPYWHVKTNSATYQLGPNLSASAALGQRLVNRNFPPITKGRRAWK